jgi:hypothetical protein
MIGVGLRMTRDQHLVGARGGGVVGLAAFHAECRPQFGGQTEIFRIVGGRYQRLDLLEGARYAEWKRSGCRLIGP